MLDHLLKYINFKQFNEMAFIKADEVKQDEVIQSLERFGDAPLLWRGQTVGRKIGKTTILYDGVVQVTNDREAYRGKLDTLVKQIIESLKLNNQPVFCTSDKSQAKFFGHPGVVVPADNFKIMWNPKVHDLLTDYADDFQPENHTPDNIKKLIDGYKTTTNLNDLHSGEMILDCKEYYWITPGKFFDLAKKSNFNTYKTVDDIKTYKDLYNVYSGYKSYLKWLKSR